MNSKIYAHSLRFQQCVVLQKGWIESANSFF